MLTVGSGGSISGPPNPTCNTDFATADCDGTQLSLLLQPGNTPNPQYCGVNKQRANVLDPNTNKLVPCTKVPSQYDNHFVTQLAAYKEVPDYLWEVVIRYGLGDPSQLGLFP